MPNEYPLDYEEEEDDLGYYPDGVKRTLTDDQVAIFRHSEVQRLLRQRQAAREAEAEERDALSEPKEVQDAEPVPGDQALRDGKSMQIQSPSVQGLEQLKDKESKASADDAEELSSDEEIIEADDEEYERFLEQERKDFAIAAEKEREKQRRYHVPYDRSVSTRRKVRELDAVQDDVQELDY